MKLSRRRVLRASGVAVVLPCLDAFQAEATGVQSQQPIRRMVCVCAPLGFYAPDFFPQQTKLQGTQEQEANLLDRTTVILGSNLGDASSHSVKNLPVLLAGGGFRH